MYLQVWHSAYAWRPLSLFFLVQVTVFLFVVCRPLPASAADVSLVWDPPSDGITIGYVLEYGTAPHSYSKRIVVGSATSYTVQGLLDGTTYYFAVRSYAASGALSDPSDEVQTTTPPASPVVSSLSLTANLASPQLVGTAITWLAAALGGITPYQFQWSVYEAGSWTIGPWTSASTWTWTPTAAADYHVKVSVRSGDSSSSSEELTQTVPFTIAAAPASASINVAAAANGGVATASSFYSDHEPEGAIDGDRNGLNWGHGGGWNDATPNSFGDWLEVAFAAPQSIDEIDVFTLQDLYAAPVSPTLTDVFTLWGITDFEVQYWNGQQWLEVPGGTVTGNTHVWRQFKFAPLTTARIRIYVTDALRGYSRITEVEAYTAVGDDGTAR
jgi:Fibronectin type III domain